MEGFDYIDRLRILQVKNYLNEAKKIVKNMLQEYPIEKDSIPLIIINSLKDNSFKYILKIYYYEELINMSRFEVK